MVAGQVEESWVNAELAAWTSLRVAPSFGPEAATSENGATSQERKPLVSDKRTAVPAGSALPCKLWEHWLTSMLSEHTPQASVRRDKTVSQVTPTVLCWLLTAHPSDIGTEPQKVYQETGHHMYSTRAQFTALWGFGFCCFKMKNADFGFFVLFFTK